MMRCSGSVSVVAVVVFFGSVVAAENRYYVEPGYVRHPRSILQNFAVDRMLKDNGFVRSIINCVLDKGPCESNGRKLRLMAPEILRGQCPGCSRTVHNQIRRVISHVQRNFPVEWSEVTRRFMNYQNPGAVPQVVEYIHQQPPPPPQQAPPQHQPHPQHPQHQQVYQQHQQQPQQLDQPQAYNPNTDPNMYQQYG